jgi:WD40 repeat protein
MWFRKTIALLVILVLALAVPILSTAEDENDDVPLVITANNIASLQPVLRYDFDALPEGLAIDSGWFALNPAGTWAALAWQGVGVVIINLDTSGDARPVSSYRFDGDSGQPATLLDAGFSAAGTLLASLHADGTHYYVAVYDVTGERSLRVLRLSLPGEGDRPVRVWLAANSPHVWLEVLAADSEHYVLRAPLPQEDGETLDLMSALVLPSGPENDAESFVRIGRIPAPLAITSTPEGLVRLWNLETGEITAEVELDGVPVFGRVNETTGRQLAWRDPESESLQVLDFETGENRVVAPLGGQYVQAILLGAEADIILGVAIGDDPIVAAWSVETGAYLTLGDYRECSRVPDMVRLSADGTTLVIGCDGGIEVWRIPD